MSDSGSREPLVLTLAASLYMIAFNLILIELNSVKQITCYTENLTNIETHVTILPGHLFLLLLVYISGIFLRITYRSYNWVDQNGSGFLLSCP